MGTNSEDYRKWIGFLKKLNEEVQTNQQNELLPAEIEKEKEEFKTYFNATINSFNVIKSNGSVSLNASLKIGEDTLVVDYNLEMATINTQKYELDDPKMETLGKVYEYYKTWRGKWYDSLNKEQ
jgi:hypothetical protein